MMVTLRIQPADPYCSIVDSKTKDVDTTSLTGKFTKQSSILEIDWPI